MEQTQQDHQNYVSSSRNLTSILEGLKGKKVLILDLDETLICFRGEPFKTAALTVNIPSTTQKNTVHICPRPGLERFLSQISKYYTLILYSTARMMCISKVLRAFNIERFFYLVLDREFCKFSVEKSYFKDISIFGLSPSDFVLIDNTPENAKVQPGNRLTIRPFNGDLEDRELAIIGKFLIKSAGLQDIRPAIADLNLYLKNNKPSQGVQAVKCSDIKPMKLSLYCTSTKDSEITLNTESSFAGINENEYDQKFSGSKELLSKEQNSEVLSTERVMRSVTSQQTPDTLIQILPSMNPKPSSTKF